MGFDDPGCTIFVKNIESRVTEELLWELFLQAGPLKNVKIPTDRASGNKRNFAFVTYRDEISVPYACELFNQIRLFKKPIYCNPSNRDGKSSFNQTPQNRSASPNTPQSPTSSNNSLIQGILNRSNSVPTPLTSTPFHGKRKFSQDEGPKFGNRIAELTGSRDSSSNSSSRLIVIDDDSDKERYNQHDDRDRNIYRDSAGRDSGGRDSGGRDSGGRDLGGRDSIGRGGGRYDDSIPYRPNNRDERDIGGYRSDERRSNDRSPGQSGRYDRSNSYNSSYGNTSPMHMHALNQSHKQYGRQGSSPRGGDFNRSPRGGDSNSSSRGGDSNFGPMRQDSNRNAKRQRSQPY